MKPIKKNERIPELQLVRGMAILCVLTVHASASATVSMADSSYYWLYNFANIFAKIGTPTFILLSSFVLFYGYFSRPLDRKLIGSFYRKRLLYIVVPYVVFSAIYYAMVQLLSHQPLLSASTLSGLGNKLVTGHAFAHLYFVIISIQFYLLFPVLLAVAKKWKGIVPWLVPIGFLVQWGFVFWNKYLQPVPNKGSWSLSYFSMFMLGAALGIYYPKIKPWLEVRLRNGCGSRFMTALLLWASWLGLSVAHVSLYYRARSFGTRYDSLWYEFLWNFQSLTASLVLIQAAFLLSRFGSPFARKTLYLLGQSSFGIYLVHLLFLTGYDLYMPNFGTAWLAHLRYLGSWFFMLGASWLTVAAAAKFVPMAWILFGNLPGRAAGGRRSESGAKPLSGTASL
ncbi:acyltransferase [Cohnella caldifontis]|uniref:acyltransferase n=1 Tax=Cohnella caldifontis TaxID=3027471 RepID=UPI0023EE0D93|nr:acyltransferase [Cohnella sp. YIM B05605]